MAEEINDKTTPDLALLSRYDRNSSPLVEITTRIRADQALALELLENAARQRGRRDFARDELI